MKVHSSFIPASLSFVDSTVTWRFKLPFVSYPMRMQSYVC